MSAVGAVRRGASVLTGRLLAALAIAAAAFALIANQEEVRAIEARLVRALVEAVTHGRATAAGSIVYFGIGTDDVVGLSITTMCSTVVLAAPLLLLAAAVLGITRACAVRVAAGLAVSLGIAVTANFVRFAMAAAAYTAAGHEGFDLVHRYLGSLFVIAGFCIAVVVLLVVSLRESRRDTRAAAGRRGTASSPSASPEDPTT